MERRHRISDMANRLKSPLLDFLTRTVSPLSKLSDGELLERFVANQDNPAFTAILRRHGPMVHGVARRALGDDSRAEDVFQAVFFLLALKAPSIRKSASLAAWLHGAAYRAAMNVRKGNVRRQRREQAVARETSSACDATPHADRSLRELQAAVDEELARLSEPIRAAFVLCYLEGHSQVEAATILNCPEGTVASRVARARAALQKGLLRRGIESASVMAAFAVGGSLVQAKVSEHLISDTARVAITIGTSGLTAGLVSPTVMAIVKGLTGMAIFKATVVASCLACLLMVGAAGAWGLGAEGGARTDHPEKNSPANSPKSPDAELKDPRDDRQADLSAKALDGDWTLTLPAGFQSNVRLERVANDVYELHADPVGVFAGRYRHEADRLLLLNKDSLGRDLRFVWKIMDVNSAALVEEPPAELTGSRYLGATLKRQENQEFDQRQLIGVWKLTRYVGVPLSEGSWRIEFLQDGKYLEDGKPHEVIKSYSLKNDRLTFHGADGTGKSVTVKKLTDKVLVWDDGGNVIELTRNHFLFHPDAVPATDLKIGITAGKTVAVAVGPEKQRLGLKLEVTIKNDSKAAISALLPREWHGGQWPPTALYAAVAPANAKVAAAYHPVYRFGESSAEARQVTIEAGGTHTIEIRADWPGTGSVPAIPLIDKPGKYSARFAIVFEASGKQQVFESDAMAVEFVDLGALTNKEPGKEPDGKNDNKNDAKKPLTAKELTGTWYGEAENISGIRKLTATLDFDIKFGGDVHWRLRYETEESNGSEIGVTSKRVEDGATGRVNLRFENRQVVLGHLARGEGDTIVLTILPEFEKRNLPGERVYRQFDGLVLRRVAPPKGPEADDLRALQGVWTVLEERGPEPLAKGYADQIKNGDIQWIFSDNRFAPGLKGAQLIPWTLIRLDASRSPREIHSLLEDGKSVRCKLIYELKGDDLRVFGWVPRQGVAPAAPKDFDPKKYPDEDWTMTILKRTADKDQVGAGPSKQVGEGNNPALGVKGSISAPDLSKFPKLKGTVRHSLGYPHSFGPPETGHEFQLDLAGLAKLKSLPFDPEKKSYLPMPGQQLAVEKLHVNDNGAFGSMRLIARDGSTTLRVDISPKPGLGPNRVLVWAVIESGGVIDHVTLVDCEADGAFPRLTNAADAKDDLVGTWIVTDDGGENPVRPDGHVKGTTWVVKDSRILFGREIKMDAAHQPLRFYKLDRTTTPARIAVNYAIRSGPTNLVQAPAQLGVYEVQGDTLRIFFDPNGQPTTFPKDGGPEQYRVLTLKRSTQE